ncbi:MAG: NAD(+)/NADH kinase [Firmicutes bacterium]|nr:NAD(+)/NADH kinase [Bacillota bacterium]
MPLIRVSWGTAMQTVGLLPHEGKPEALATTEAFITLLRKAGFTPRLEERTASRLGHPAFGVAPEAFVEGLDLVIALGGDGALLRAAHRVYPREIPLFGVNFGHVGFLAEVEAQEVAEAVRRLRAGEYRVEDRLMVAASVGRPGTTPLVALNDVVIAKRGQARMISLAIVLNGVTLTEYRADGLIVATPTGSTAYSLSAGGPILQPTLAALVVTPVCAHALHARPLVLGAEEEVTVRILAPHEEVVLVADGYETLALLPGDEIHFRRATAVTRLLRFTGPGFYELLRERFRAGKL